MKTKAVRLYGKSDLRLEEFDLSPIGDDGVRVKVITDSLCMSSYKSATQGADHKRVPNDIATNPTVIGHEFCGEIIEVGKNYADKYKVGQNFVIQPAHYYNGSQEAPGYSYTECGGDMTYANIPRETLIMDCLLPYDSNMFFLGSLAEPVCCVIGTFHAMYHTTPGSYEHKMGIVEGGKMALLASVGPMGLAGIDYAINCDRRPSLLVVTDIDQTRLDRAASIYTVEAAKKNGVELHYVNTKDMQDPVAELRKITGDTGYDDVICFAPVRALVEQADAILGFDGCLNFFAGPSNTEFKAELNFYDVHYAYHHIVGTSGGNTDDLIEAVDLIAKGILNPAPMITHIGGLNSVIDSTLNLPKIPGGKKLIYNHIDMELTAIADFEEKGKTDPLFAKLHEICARNNGLWSKEAEDYIIQNG